jgi:hypothetical protein
MITNKKPKIPESVRAVVDGIRQIEGMSRHPNSDARIGQVAEALMSEIENNPGLWGSLPR